MFLLGEFGFSSQSGLSLKVPLADLIGELQSSRTPDLEIHF